MTNPPSIAEVVLFKQADQPLHYFIPEPFRDCLEVGMRVLVPVRAQSAIGLVVGFAEKPAVPHLKSILELLDTAPVLDEPLLKLTRSLADYYLTSWGAAIRAILPPGLDTSPRLLYRLTDQGREVQASSSGSLNLRQTQRAVLRVLAHSHLAGRQGLTAKTLANRARLASPASNLRTLIQKEWVERYSLLPRARPGSGVARVDPASEPRQQALPIFPLARETVMKAISEALSSNRFEVFCLPGFLEEETLSLIAVAAERVLNQSHEVLILVPEVDQVQPVAKHFAVALGRPVGILHGELSTGLRRATWSRIAAGDLPVVVGTRTAVFAPMKALGLIVVTEEADPSYKAEESPPYHARDVALMRGQTRQIPVLLTAPAPSLETYAKCQNQQYRLLGNTSPFSPRLQGRGQLITSVVDLKSLPPKQVLSGRLVTAIGKRLQGGRAVLLVLNRRGFATALICRDCGHVFRCPRCRVAQALHRKANRVICHYCGMSQSPPMSCPTCKGVRLGGVGVGIEQAEEVLRQTFPKARIVRVDRASSRPISKKADIYLGTERVFRGSQRPRVDLVGVLDADSYLHLPDYRAGELTFQWMVQAVASFQPSEVIVQTRCPEHESIAWVKDMDPDRFYRQELSERGSLGYPPFMRLASILIKSSKAAGAAAYAQRLGERLREMARSASGEKNEVQVLGPAPAPLSLLRGKHRFLILVKAASDVLLSDLLLRGLDPVRLRRGASAIEVTVNVDPLHLR